MQYLLYTDGACQPNPGAGGWAFVLLRGDQEIMKKSGWEPPPTTNNRMELLAVLNGMSSFSDYITNDDDELNICSDSMYLINGIREWSKRWRDNGWIKADKKPVLNQDLWEQIRNIADFMNLSFTHIKGHSGHKYNELVDKLAVEMVDRNGLLQNSGN